MQIGALALGKYRVLRMIGSGEFSFVYHAREELTDRAVAIKALKKSAYPPSFKKFSDSEFRAMSKVWGHRNIVSMHTIEPAKPGEEDYAAYIVMEYVEGKNLDEWIQHGAMSLTDTLNIGLDICRGLKEIHKHNIIHRDIKPKNILLTTENEAKIADLGIARILGENTEFSETRAGSYDYMAPEQIDGQYDHQVDLYSTGLVLYQAATGSFPFSGKHDEIKHRKTLGQVKDIDRCDKVLRNFLTKALHRDPSKRHQTADEMYEELDRIRQDARISIEEVPLEPLPDQAHHKEASRILAQIHEQKERSRKFKSLYKKLGKFYQKQATIFVKKKKDDSEGLELVADCYRRARLAYKEAGKQRLVRKNAKKGGIYYTRLAQLELQRSWEAAGKSYIYAAYNHASANEPDLVEERYLMATICYLNAAKSAHLNQELQTAYNFYTLVVAIGEKMSTPTKMVSEAQKLISKIPAFHVDNRP